MRFDLGYVDLVFHNKWKWWVVGIKFSRYSVEIFLGPVHVGVYW